MNFVQWLVLILTYELLISITLLVSDWLHLKLQASLLQYIVGKNSIFKWSVFEFRVTGGKKYLDDLLFPVRIWSVHKTDFFTKRFHLFHHNAKETRKLKPDSRFWSNAQRYCCYTKPWYSWTHYFAKAPKYELACSSSLPVVFYALVQNRMRKSQNFLSNIWDWTGLDSTNHSLKRFVQNTDSFRNKIGVFTKVLINLSFNLFVQKALISSSEIAYCLSRYYIWIWTSLVTAKKVSSK